MNHPRRLSAPRSAATPQDATPAPWQNECRAALSLMQFAPVVRLSPCRVGCLFSGLLRVEAVEQRRTHSGFWRLA